MPVYAQKEDFLRSDVDTLAGLTLQTVTGYLLLYAGDDGWWGVVSPSHWVAGLSLPLAYAGHRLIHRLRPNQA